MVSGEVKDTDGLVVFSYSSLIRDGHLTFNFSAPMAERSEA